MAKRRARASARSSRRSAPTHLIQEEQEEEGGVEEEQEDSRQIPSPQAAAEPADAEGPIDEDEVEDGDGGDLEGEETNTPAQDSQDDESPPLRGPRKARSSRPRRAGRPAKHVRGTRVEDWGTPEQASPEPTADDVASEIETTTPRTAGRARKGRSAGGFRGRIKANRGPSHVSQPPTDKEGNMLDVVDDEVDLPEDQEGEKKVDKSGALNDGREYRVRTFKLIGRGNKLYMLSTEPARCTGFRDSYLFFAKHPTLYKIIIDDAEKKDLIDRELIPHSYKGRAIGVVTARSVFREFGCKIIVGGKKITDDYKVAEARARGDREGDLADPTDAVPPPGRSYNRNQYVAWHGASAVYHSSNAPSIPLGGRPNILGKRKTNVTEENWMLEHALAANRYNSSLASARRQTMDGVYDTHTNFISYPSSTQPTHARWELVASTPRDAKRRKLEGVNGKSVSLTNGDVIPRDGLDHEKQVQEVAGADMDQSKIFTPLSSVLTRNFIIVDTLFQNPAESAFCAPGPPVSSNEHAIVSGPPGLPSLTEAQMEDMDLPEDCKVALRAAKLAELEWTNSWSTEEVDGLRGQLRIGVGT